MSAEDLKEAAKDLPKSWEVFHSKKSNRLYYYNNVTKKTQWHHPSLGEKNKQDEKSKSKKRKAPGDEQNKVKFSDSKQSLKQKDEKNHELTNTFRVKKEQTNSNCVAESSKPPVKMFFKALPKLSFKLKTTKPLENTKSNAFFSKPCKETVKSNAQIFETHKESDKTNARTSNSAKSYTLGNKLSNQAIKSNLETANTAEKSGKNNPKASDNSKEPKTPAFLNNKVPSKTKKIPKLQPLLRTKSLGEGSDSGVSDSSDRILAWLADTSRIDFKDHPIPNINITENEVAKSKGEQDHTTVVKQKSGQNTAEKQNRDTHKIAILKRVETNFKHKSDVLDKVLPKHSQTHGKKRYTPYQLTTPNLKHDKAKDSSKAEQEKCPPVQTNARTTAGHIVKTTTANQNSLSSELANSVAKKIGGKPTAGQNGFLVSETVVNKNSTTNSFGVNGNVSTNVGSIRSIDNTSRKNSLQDNVHEVQRLVDGEAIQEFGGVSDNVLQQDDVLSMEEGAGSSAVSIPLSDSDVADMDIDNAEEFAREIVKELKEMRSSLVVRPDQISNGQMAMKISSEGYEGTLYIVLDTNVLLSHLKFVIELKDFPIPGVGMPILVIPWVVIQELDSLKENRWKSHESGDKTTRVDMLARHAIKFLNSSFQKSDPRVRGQTISEAAEHVGTLQEETNDDRILQCCLLFHNRAQNGSCVLFSNDVNLCNKAMVNGIKAFNHEKLLPGLKDLFQCGAVVKQHSEEYNMQLAIEEDLSRRRQKADDITCELQIILREGLSYIIESEMKKAYDDLWLEIVYIKPPWTLIDVLQLLDKHWIAVFGHILKRDKKQLIDKLRKKFDDRKGTASSLQFCSEMLQLALQLFQSFAYHSNYDDAMPKCLAAVNVLVQKCQQFQASVSGAAQVKCLTYPSDPTTSKVTTIENNNQNHGEMVSSNQTVPHEEVMNTFNLIWTAVTQFSSQIFTALGYPNTIAEGTTQDYPKASKEEAISFLRVLCPRLLNVVHCIQNVLRDPWERVSQNDSLFIQLEQAIAVFLKEVLSQENNATAEKLFKFCEDPSVRTSLVQGLSQLDRASAMLQHCASCVVQSSTMSS